MRGNHLFKSLCIIGVGSWWRYAMPLATSIAIPYLIGMSNTLKRDTVKL